MRRCGSKRSIAWSTPLSRTDGERLLLAIHAVRYLCACDKDRSSDEMVIWIKHEVENNGLRPTIPDYALDMHTLAGQEMGRDIRHFLEDGALLSPEMPDRDRTYRERVMEILADNGCVCDGSDRIDEFVIEEWTPTHPNWRRS